MYKEDRCYLLIAPPAGSHLVYSSANLRKVSVKQPDRAKLVKRFLALREFIRSNKDKMIRLQFNINEKV